jgi:hypothetical protein
MMINPFFIYLITSYLLTIIPYEWERYSTADCSFFLVLNSTQEARLCLDSFYLLYNNNENDLRLISNIELVITKTKKWSLTSNVIH